MSGAFDPYLKWLAILPEEQPPNHYRLLGVPLFLNDHDVIENAADQRMAHVRNFGAGKHSDLSQKILNEISAAKITLLNSNKKAAYDQQLRSEQTLPKKQQAAPASNADQPHAERPTLKTRRVEPSNKASGHATVVEHQPSNPTGIDVTPRETTTSGRVSRHRSKPVWQQPPTIVVGVALLLAVVVGALVMLSGGKHDPEVADEETKSNTKSDDTGGFGTSASRKQAGTKSRFQIGDSSQDDPKLRFDPKPTVQVKTATASTQKNDPRIVATTSSGGKTATTGQSTTSVSGPATNARQTKVAEDLAGRFALRFDAEDFVELTGSRGSIQLDEPFTAEIWLRQADSDGLFMIFGDHCLGKKPPHDTREGIVGWAWRLQNQKSQYLMGIHYSTSSGGAMGSLLPLPSLGDQWHHLALCSTPESARIYVDGKLHKAHPSISGQIRPSYSSLYLGGMEYTPPYGLQGDIRAFRLSAVDRYKSDFTPPADFPKDDQTITLFDFSEGQGAELNDLTGKYPGRIFGAEWIRLEPANADTKLDKPKVADETVAEKDSAEKRLPVPDEESLKAKQTVVAELFGEQIKTARSKAEKGEIAQLLLAEGRRTQDDPVGRYVLFDEALNNAIDSGNVELATEIVGALAGEFDVDALQLNADMLTSTVRTVENNEQRSGVARSAIELADKAIRAERFDMAESLSKLISSAATRVRDVELRKASNTLRTRVRLYKAGWEAFQKAAVTLQEQPDDAEAHLARGRYLALIKQDWKAGLPHLTKGSDTALAKLAQQEAASSTSVEERLALADAWYKWAGRASGVEEEGGFARALHWYQNVLPDASNLQAKKINLRIDELADKVKPIKTGVARLPWIRGPVGLIREFNKHDKGAMAFDVSADGRYALTGSKDSILRVYDLATGEEKRITTTAHANPAVFTPDGGHVIAQDTWGIQSVIDWRTGERKLRYTSGFTAFDMILLPKKPIVLILAREPMIHGWNYTTGKEEFRLPVPEGTRQIAVTPDGRRAILGQMESKVAIFDLAAGKVIHQLEPHPNPMHAIQEVAVSRDGRLGLSAAPGGPARVWDMRTGKLLHSLNTNYVVGGDFSPDGRRAVVAGFSKSLGVWDLQTGTKLHNFPTPSNRNGYAKFTPDGRGIVSADKYSGMVSLFRIADPE